MPPAGSKEVIFRGKERRKYVRITEPLTVRFRIIDRNTSACVADWKECQTRDISRGGACIEIENADKELFKAINNDINVFELEINMFADRKVKAKGDVNYFHGLAEAVWNYLRQENIVIGIRFFEISEDDEELISQYIVDMYLKKYGGKSDRPKL
jgi:c-di-GMP-binding flagellar brake protein YcgR